MLHDLTQVAYLPLHMFSQGMPVLHTSTPTISPGRIKELLSQG